MNCLPPSTTLVPFTSTLSPLSSYSFFTCGLVLGSNEKLYFHSLTHSFLFSGPLQDCYQSLSVLAIIQDPPLAHLYSNQVLRGVSLRNRVVRVVYQENLLYPKKLNIKNLTRGNSDFCCLLNILIVLYQIYYRFHNLTIPVIPVLFISWQITQSNYCQLSFCTPKLFHTHFIMCLGNSVSMLYPFH